MKVIRNTPLTVRIVLDGTESQELLDLLAAIRGACAASSDYRDTMLFVQHGERGLTEDYYFAHSIDGTQEIH